MKNLKNISIILAATVYGLFLSVIPSYAIVIRSGDTITIPKDATINESLFAGGESITIDGTVDGDVFCGGQDIEIAGTVNGDVICGGQSVTVSGRVLGNVRVGGQNVRINGTVERNANLFGQKIELSSGSAILGETLIGAQKADISGSLAKKLSGGVQSMKINGTVAQTDVHVNSLALGSSAVIQKDLMYTSNKEAEIARADSVGGKTIRNTPPPRARQAERRNERVIGSLLSGARIAGLISEILLAFLVVYFLSKRIQNASMAMQERPLPAFGWGALMLILFPIIMILFVVTIVGIPLAMALLFVFIFAFFLSRVLAAYVVGRMLLQQFWTAKKESRYWIVAIGFIVLWLVYSAPYVGGLIGFLSFIWGLGGVYYMLRPVAQVHETKKTTKK